MFVAEGVTAGVLAQHLRRMQGKTGRTARLTEEGSCLIHGLGVLRPEGLAAADGRAVVVAQR